jgi:hypothetical protein
MKHSRLHLVLLGLFTLSVLTANAAQLASAKVLSISGTVNTNTEDSQSKPLKTGDILKQGDSIVTTALSSAHLVFSNGSELTVQENTSVTLAELTQEAFSGKKSYEQLQADPSKSQSLLELNYGKVSGHVKQLKEGSDFHIQTPLGTAAIRGTKFSVDLSYNRERGEYVLVVNNFDGKVDVLSRVGDSLEFGRGKRADKGFEADNPDTINSIPAGHIVTIRISEDDPNYDDVIDVLKNYAPFQGGDDRPETIIIVTPPIEDPGVQIASPNEPEQTN